MPQAQTVQVVFVMGYKIFHLTAAGSNPVQVANYTLIMSTNWCL